MTDLTMIQVFGGYIVAVSSLIVLTGAVVMQGVWILDSLAKYKHWALLTLLIYPLIGALMIYFG